MSRKNKGKKGYEEVKEEEWIEMRDLNDPQNESISRKFAEEEGKRYQPTHEGHNANYPSNQNRGSQNYEKSIPQRNFNKQNERKALPKDERRQKKPSIPMMFVTCQYCTVAQNVPGNTQVYTCGSCENMNECEPLYGVFICGFCQTKVCYGFGISIMIKCPKCKSVNKAPAEATKKYESIPKPATQFPKKQQQRTKQEYERPQYMEFQSESREKVEEPPQDYLKFQ